MAPTSVRLKFNSAWCPELTEAANREAIGSACSRIEIPFFRNLRPNLGQYTPRKAYQIDTMKPSLLFNLRCAAALLFGGAAAANANSYVVNSTGDQPLYNNRLNFCETGPFNGVCTLPAAIQISNNVGGTNTITFNIPTSDPGYSNGTWTINLTNALPDVTASVDITGPGPAKLVIQNANPNGNRFRIFTITTTGTVNLSSLAIANGSLFDSNGGGIQNANGGAMNLTNCALSGNQTGGLGGGVYNGSGSMNVTNCTFTGNGSGQGGGIWNGGTMNVTGCTFNGDNYAGFAGGGGINNEGTMNVTNCTISGNQGYDGGGIANGHILTVTGCTISWNSGGYDGDSGGGISNYSGGTVTVTNTTITSNSAYSGGGIFNDAGGIISISGSTITNNSVSLDDNGFEGMGGGIYSIPSNGSSVKIKSSIIALNTAASSDPDLTGSFISNGYNLIGDNQDVETSFPAGNPNANNDIVGTYSSPIDPKLDPKGLQNNGGPTQTIALLPLSPAIDKGSGTTVAGVHLIADQRGVGYKRTINKAIANSAGGDGTDVGAFELGAQIKAVSTLVHGSAGTFNVNLPLFGTKPAVECRSGGASGIYKVNLTFPNAVTVSNAAVSLDPKAAGATGSVSSFSVSSSKVTVNLTGVSNAQTIHINLSGVSDGTNTNDVSVPMGVLLGDTGNNGSVASNDVSLTQSKVGQTTGTSNFREDVNLDGVINSADVNLVQSKVGTKLP